MQYGNNPIEIGCLQPTAYSLLLDRGYTSHEHLFEVGLIHMNGRLYDPLLRRFLNADEHIQDPYNTQNYNKYGYVYNNPLMYNDPDGELIWFIVAGAVISAYMTGVKANGSWNPFKWNWAKTWDKIALGAIVGAVSGGAAAYAGGLAATYAAAAWGIKGGILGGVIAGTAGGLVGGAISGFGDAAIYGESIGRGIVKGMITGVVAGGIIGGISGGIQQGIANAKVANTGVGVKGNIWTGKAVAHGRSPWALQNTPKTTSVGKINNSPKLQVGDIVPNGIETTGNGTIKLKDLGDGVKAPLKPNEIIQSVKEYNVTGKGLLNGHVDISKSDFDILYNSYRSIGAETARGFKFNYLNNYSGGFYMSTSGGVPSMHIRNTVSGWEYKIRFHIIK